MNAVIFDIDGTIADMEWRRDHVRSLDRKQRNWKAFNEGMSRDEPKEPIVRLLHCLRATGNSIVACSGREAEFRDVTNKWLAFHKIPIDALYMRASKDYRDDTVVKRELLTQIHNDGFLPWLVIDDRDKVVKMWREQGLTCLQCCEGNF